MKFLTFAAVSLLLMSLAGVSYSQIPQIEREALIALYNSTDGANWTENGSWNGAAGTECYWHGVTCTSGVITQLSLSNNSLTGSIPPELGNLVNLIYLYLNNNSLTGSLPVELNNLQVLRIFQVSHNNLSGSVEHIFGTCSVAPCSPRMMSQSAYSPIFLSYSNLYNTVYLNNNQFTGSITSLLGAVGASINDNQFTGLVPQVYDPGELHVRPNLNYGNNEFKCNERSDNWPGYGCMDTYPKRYLSCARGLCNRYNAFSSHERIALLLLYHGTGGENWTNNDNWLGDKGTECTWYGVTCTDGIITGLYLNNNNLVGSLPNDIGDLIDLENLYLNNNKITGSLPATMGQLSKLEYLNLYDNQLSGSIPTEFGDLTNLKTLDLESNQLTGPIPTELENLTQLTRLALSSNTLEGSTPQWIVDMNIADLSLETAFITTNREALTALYASAGGSNWTNKSNWMNNPGTECTWFGITCQDGNVTIINLAGNNLTGSIPSKIGGSTNLTKLDLSSNQLSGSIPAEIGNLSNLTTLLLPNNQLSGSIPAEAGSLDNLTTLTLTGNQLSGTIPSELGLLLKLETLDISSNSLTGSIPTALSSLASLKTINLSSNKLGGSIPSVVGNLSGLTYLNFSDNLLSSSVPAELGNLGDLTDFNLSNNQLSGNLPAQLGELSKLSSLNLSSNRFSGYAPQWLLQMGTEELLLEDAFGSNYPPVISITGGDQTVTDTDDIAGESVSLTGTATDQDGRIVSTQWLVGGSEVATGLTLTIALSNGATVVTFKATDNDGDSSTTTATITVEAPNVSPSVAISGGNRTISDTNNIAGESVSFTGTATDSDGTIATTQWLVGGSVVATGLTPTILLMDGSTVVTFKATDDDDDSSTTTVTITVQAPDYIPAEEWPFPYSGVTPNYSSLEESAFARGHFLTKPDSSSGLEPNNIGIFNPADLTIYTCLRVYTEGLPGSFGGIGEFDIGFTVFSPEEGTVQVSGFREFNETGALNEYGERPDCSGKLETTTGIYTDIIQSGDGIFQTTFSLTDPANLTLRLESYETLSH